MAVLLDGLFDDLVLPLPYPQELPAHLAARLGDGVELARPLLADIPLALDQAPFLQPPEQGIEGVLLDFVAQVAEGAHHGVAVGLLLQNHQDQELQEAALHLGLDACQLIVHVASKSPGHIHTV